jgi:hypothetical protein
MINVNSLFYDRMTANDAYQLHTAVLKSGAEISGHFHSENLNSSVKETVFSGKSFRYYDGRS